VSSRRGGDRGLTGVAFFKKRGERLLKQRKSPSRSNMVPGENRAKKKENEKTGHHKKKRVYGWWAETGTERAK